MDLLFGNALASEVRDAALFRAQQDVADRVGEHPVDLFGHGAVEAAQARFDVDEPHTELHGHQGAGDRAVDVAHHQHRVGVVLEDDGLEGLHGLGGLDGVGGAPDLEVEVWARGSPTG